MQTDSSSSSLIRATQETPRRVAVLSRQATVAIKGLLQLQLAFESKPVVVHVADSRKVWTQSIQLDMYGVQRGSLHFLKMGLSLLIPRHLTSQTSSCIGAAVNPTAK